MGMIHDQVAAAHGLQTGEKVYARGTAHGRGFRTALTAALAVLTSCASYEPRPLDGPAHIQEWLDRRLQAETLQARLQRMDLEWQDGAVQFDAHDGLQLAEAQWVALAFNPGLRLERLRLTQAAVAAQKSARWPDPRFTLSALELREETPDPWVITQGLEFSLPLSGRAGAYGDLKQAQEQVAMRTVREAEWGVLHGLALAWVQWSASQLRIEQTERHLESLAPIIETTIGLALSGEILPTEASLVALEHAMQESRLEGLRGQATVYRQQLLALMGLPPGHQVLLLPNLTADGNGGPASQAHESALAARNPGLARLREEYQAQEHALRMEVAKQWPDLGLGPAFESDEGRAKLGLIGGLTLPLWNANSESIASARVEREWARAALEAEHEALLGRLAASTLRTESLERQRAHMEQTLVPLLDQQVHDATRLVQLGEGSTIVLVESLTRAHQVQLDWISMRASLAETSHERVFLIGPSQRAPESATEEPIQ
jgi:cobalt-zinc-cadmium efflux system outer membrane protein